VGSAARLHPDQARWQVGKKGQNLAACELDPQCSHARRISTMHLETSFSTYNGCSSCRIASSLLEFERACDTQRDLVAHQRQILLNAEVASLNFASGLETRSEGLVDRVSAGADETDSQGHERYGKL
jgi:hypothetical protein